MKYLAFLCISIFITSFSLANTGKYRLSVNGDPSNSMTIAWEQNGGSGTMVHYGTVDHGTNIGMYPMTHGIDRQVNAKGMTNCFARLTGLTPNTVYYFVIADSDGNSSRYSFRTLSAFSNDPISLICGGDSRIFTDNSARVNANVMVAKLRPDAIVFAGDFTWLDLDLEWDSWLDDWQSTISADGRMYPIITARGNHELSSSVVYDLFDVPSADEYYAINLGGDLMRLYTLNTEVSISGAQTNWLEADLIATGDNVEWKMAQFHQPIRSHVSSEPEGNTQYNNWAQLFYDYGVRLVLESDSHDQKVTWPIEPSTDAGSELGFKRNDINGTVYMGEGTWGVPLRTNDDDKVWTKNSGSFNGVQWVKVKRDSIEIRFVNTDNANQVGALTDADRFTPPSNINIWNPSNGEVTYIVNNKYAGRPMVEVTNPFHEQVFPSAQQVTITADAIDTNGTIDYVEFFVNDVSIGTDATAAYSMNWTMPSDGTYVITAWAYDNEGFHNISDIVRIYAGTFDITSQVNSNNDDAEENKDDGGVDLTSSDLEIAVEEIPILPDNDQWVGLRFTGINIPQGMVVSNAYIEFTSDEGNSSSSNLTIYGIAADDPDSFNGNNNNISSRARTSNTVAWSPSSWNSEDAGTNTQTPDLTAIVQEILDRPGWAYGNSIGFVIDGTGTRSAYSYDASSSKAARLHITASGVVGVNENEEIKWTIYPNPATDQVNINLPTSMTQSKVQLRTLNGQLVQQEVFNGSFNTLHFNKDLAAGTYLLSVYTNGQRYTKKLIIQ